MTGGKAAAMAKKPYSLPLMSRRSNLHPSHKVATCLLNILEGTKNRRNRFISRSWLLTMGQMPRRLLLVLLSILSVFNRRLGKRRRRRALGSTRIPWLNQRTSDGIYCITIIAHSITLNSAGGVGFGAGAAIGGGLVRAIF